MLFCVLLQPRGARGGVRRAHPPPAPRADTNTHRQRVRHPDPRPHASARHLRAALANGVEVIRGTRIHREQNTPSV